jgi:flagellar biosynthesis protein FlhB
MAPRAALVLAAGTAVRMVAWPLAAAVACGALASLAQTGPLFAPRRLAPNLGRLDPARRLGRLFAPAEIASRASGIALAALLLGAAATVVLDALPGLAGRTDARAVLGAIGAVMRALAERTLPILALAAATAIVYRRIAFFRAQRMTRREQLREQREVEGDPRIRRRRAELARVRALLPSEHEALDDAALVVRGADRAAVLRWSPASDEPPVVRLSVRGLAVPRLAELASKRGVPCVRDELLALDLERLLGGRTLPRASLRRLATHLARSRR